MKIALLGYGRMGKAIEKIAVKKGHIIAAIIDKTSSKGNIKNADVAINFSVPNSALDNIALALDKSIPVICGTTGWLENYQQAVDLTKKNNTAFLFSSNFSIGVNIFFKINQTLAKMMKNHKGYLASIEETHHIHKLDKPSGTAITIAEGIIDNTDLNDWHLDKSVENGLRINSVRKNEINGKHVVQYTSDIDLISLYHEAYNRDGFASGAILAAEWILGKKGIFKMDDVLNL